MALSVVRNLIISLAYLVTCDGIMGVKQTLQHLNSLGQPVVISSYPRRKLEQIVHLHSTGAVIIMQDICQCTICTI